MTPTLRPAKSTESGKVGALLSSFSSETDWLPKIHSGAEDIAHAGMLIDRGWVVVAEIDSDVVGFIARDGFVVHALYVSSSLRNQGIGATLLNHSKAAINRLDLWTFQANDAAQRFYKRHGFLESARTDGAGNDEKLPDIQFRWQREERS